MNNTNNRRFGGWMNKSTNIKKQSSWAVRVPATKSPWPKIHPTVSRITATEQRTFKHLQRTTRPPMKLRFQSQSHVTSWVNQLNAYNDKIARSTSYWFLGSTRQFWSPQMGRRQTRLTNQQAALKANENNDDASDFHHTCRSHSAVRSITRLTSSHIITDGESSVLISKRFG